MLTMNEFYNELSASSKSLAPYIKALSAFMKISRIELIAIAGDLSWHAW